MEIMENQHQYHKVIKMQLYKAMFRKFLKWGFTSHIPQNIFEVIFKRILTKKHEQTAKPNHRKKETNFTNSELN